MLQLLTWRRSLLVWYKQEVLVDKTPVRPSGRGRLFLLSQSMTWDDPGSFMLMICTFFHRHFAYIALLFVFRGGDRFKLGKLSQTENLKSYPLFVFLRDHFSTVEKKIILQSTVALKKSYTERLAHLFPNR